MDNKEATYSEAHAEDKQQDARTIDHLDEVESAQAAEENVETDPQVSQIEELTKKAEESYQRFLRTQADFDNFRRRSRQEKEEFAKYASSQLVEQLLPVIDNFERAFIASKDNTDPDAFVKGVDMILRQLLKVLDEEGLKPMESVGQPFNPEVHQAIMQVESDQYEEGYVVEEIVKGYVMKDKVLRPAMVKVSK